MLDTALDQMKYMSSVIKIVKELEDRGYINSVEPKSPIRIRFNSHFASEVIPEIFPKM